MMLATWSTFLKHSLTVVVLGNLVSAVPASSVRALTSSPDGTCGGSKGYTCVGTTFGNCCSSAGWCGSGDAWCGTGCQPAYGTCSSSGTSTSTSTSLTSTSTATPGLAQCLANKNVPTRLISSPDFQQLVEPYNLRLPYTPAAIVLPSTPKHVQDAVNCARRNNVKVQAKSGGHSYASYSSGGKDGSLVIDLEPMQSITVDAAGVATVGGGVRLGNLALGIYNSKQRALSHGTCPGVGIGGHFTHGGFGYSSRMWGLALDAIVGLDVVLPNGTYVHATSTQYPDVYWACRGAADSFGIVVNFHIQTKPAPATVINFSYAIPGMFTSAATSAKAFLHIQDFARNASVVDRNIGFGMYLDGSGFQISGTYFGSLATFNSKIAPALLQSLPTPSTSTVKAVDWITSLTMLSGQSSLQEPLTGYNAHDNFYAKSVTVPESTPLTSAALQNYFDYIIRNPRSGWFSIINLYGGPDSQINNKDTNFAAYSDRNSLWVVQHYGFADASAIPFPSNIVPFVDGLNTAFTSKMPNTQFGAYLNYVDPNLTPSQAHSLYYGDALYARLLALKKTVDPKNVFWNPQAIGV